MPFLQVCSGLAGAGEDHRQFPVLGTRSSRFSPGLTFVALVVSSTPARSCLESSVLFCSSPLVRLSSHCLYKACSLSPRFCRRRVVKARASLFKPHAPVSSSEFVVPLLLNQSTMASLSKSFAALAALASLTQAQLFQNGTVIAPCDSPIYCHGDILAEIQLARPFDDSKTFVDM